MSIVLLLIAIGLDHINYTEKIAYGIYDLFDFYISSNGVIVGAFILGLFIDIISKVLGTIKILFKKP